MAEFKDAIFYLCDRKKCEDCSSECMLTEDIRHAKNFDFTEYGNFVERDLEITKEFLRELAERINKIIESE